MSMGRRSDSGVIKLMVISTLVSSPRSWVRYSVATSNLAMILTKLLQAIEVMNVGPSENGLRPAFSKDVLVLEITGPSQEHFGVIDVPGTFKRTTQG